MQKERSIQAIERELNLQVMELGRKQTYFREAGHFQGLGMTCSPLSTWRRIMLATFAQALTPVLGYYLYIGGGVLTLVIIILLVFFLLRRG